MRYLRQSTRQTRVLGPVVATADYSRKADLAYNASGMDFNLYKNGTQVDVTPATAAGDECWAASVNGYYAFTFSVGDTDTLGSAMVTVDATGYTMPPHTFSVLSQAVYDSLFGAVAPASSASVTALGAGIDALLALMLTLDEIVVGLSLGPTDWPPIGPATLDTSGVPLGCPANGATITAYAAADTGQVTPIAQTTVAVGTWSMNVPPAATHTLIAVKAGYGTTTSEVTVA